MKKIKYKKGSNAISQLQSNFLSNYFFISFINVSILLHFFREFYVYCHSWIPFSAIIYSK